MSVRSATLCDFRVDQASGPCGNLSIGVCITCLRDTCKDHQHAELIFAYAVSTPSAPIHNIAIRDANARIATATVCAACRASSEGGLPYIDDVREVLTNAVTQLGEAARARIAAAALRKR